MAQPSSLAFALALLAGSLCPAPGVADVTRPASEVACGAPLPDAGAIFEGTVLHVPDGRTLCVAQGPTPAQWLRVTLSDTDAATLRRDLMSATFAKRVVCRSVGRARASVLAECEVGGVPLADMLQRPSVRLAAFIWR